MSAAADALRERLAAQAGIDPGLLTDDMPLISSGLLTSLQAVELVDLAETLTGRPVDLDALNAETFSTLRSMRAHLLGERDGPDMPPAAGSGVHASADRPANGTASAGFSPDVAPQPAPPPDLTPPIAAPPLRGDALSSLRRFDDLVASLARRAGAVEERHSPCVPVDVLRRAGWLASFPHLATFAAPVEPAARARVGATQRVGVADLAEPSQALAAAACHAVFAARAGVRLDAPERISVASPCFRAEATDEPLVRQRCFTMREIVLIGSPEEVRAFVARWQLALPRLATALGIAARMHEASDPFCDPSRDPKARAQGLLGPVKHELVDARGVALASVNLHRSFFADAFGFGFAPGRRPPAPRASHHGCDAAPGHGLDAALGHGLDAALAPGRDAAPDPDRDVAPGASPCWSACVAFGLERWTGALMTSSPDWDAAAQVQP